MAKTKTVTRSVTTLEFEELELELSFEPDDHYYELLVQRRPDGKIVVGYLVRNDDCGNPLEDCDGVGQVHDVRQRHRTSEAVRAYQAACGLDEDWQRDEENCEQDPHAVLLTAYEHGGTAWALADSPEARNFPDQQWDVSHGCGVWVPDECCREHILAAAWKACGGPGIQYRYLSDAGSDNCYQLRLPSGRWSPKRYPNSLAAWQAGAKASKFEPEPAKYLAEQRVEARKCAAQAVEDYNKWLSGDCWGKCIDVFTAEGQLDSDEACWGFVGGDYAYEELQSEFESTCGKSEVGTEAG